MKRGTQRLQAAPSPIPVEVLDDQVVHELVAQGELVPLSGEAPVDRRAVARLRQAVAQRLQRRRQPKRRA